MHSPPGWSSYAALSDWDTTRSLPPLASRPTRPGRNGPTRAPGSRTLFPNRRKRREQRIHFFRQARAKTAHCGYKALKERIMPLDPKRVEAVFLAAMEASEPAAQTAILDRECGDDVELRRRVEGL